MTLISGILLLPLLTYLKFGQVVRDDGPQSHLKKTGTPTMGGIIFLIPLVLVCSFFAIKYPGILPVLIATLLFGVVGFIDDYMKIVLKRSKGLTARQKMLALLVVSTGFTFYLLDYFNIGTDIAVPFTSIMLDLEWFFIPFSILVMVATTNSVNLTDGLDGLAAGISLIIMIFFTMVAMAMQNIEMIIFCSALAGVCLGFLAFNMHPARVFMGDTGSLALGGAIACVGILMKIPLVILIIAGIPVVEALSVIIQVVVYKIKGKRVFKMAPIHHHFELLGWSENKVVWTFWGITLLLCFIGLISLRYNVI